MIMTVAGAMEAADFGVALPHEHVLVDFIGAERIGPDRYDANVAFATILPYLVRAKKSGIGMIAECTPAYLGRDPLLLKRLSEASGINILTNTGYYGSRDGAFLPAHAYRESAETLAERWIAEWESGIAGTGLKPGFIKTAVNCGRPLSDMDRKLVRAAAIAHKRTGLTIASHTKDGPVLEELEILRLEGVDPSAFIWVHAQDEPDKRRHIAAAELGAWVEFDAVGRKTAQYSDLLANMRERGLLGRVLLSHDAGWYEPGNPGREYADYEPLVTRLVPALKKRSFTDDEIEQVVKRNPIEAFTIRRRDCEYGTARII